MSDHKEKEFDEHYKREEKVRDPFDVDCEKYHEEKDDKILEEAKEKNRSSFTHIRGYPKCDYVICNDCKKKFNTGLKGIMETMDHNCRKGEINEK